MTAHEWFDLCRETFRGKSLGRILLNQAMRREVGRLEGRVLDVAGGGASYARYLDMGHAEVIATNMDAKRHGAVPHDFHQPFPFADASFDAALFINALYIARDPGLVFRHVARVLKPGGRFFVASPFVFPENPEPDDFGRPTAQGLRRLAEENGYAVLRLVPVSGRAAAGEYLIDDAFLFAPLKLVARAFAILLDAALNARFNRLKPAPTAWLMTAEKNRAGATAGAMPRS